MLTAAVSAAVDAVRAHFVGQSVEVAPDGAGGATIIIDQIAVGPGYSPSFTWLGFHISAAYPDADIYPHRVGVLARTDGQAHGPAIQHVTWVNRQALQISRRSNRRDPAVDTAANKAERILTWLRAQ
jgi:hypothetical protein